jgi:O-antigen ligase
MIRHTLFLQKKVFFGLMLAVIATTLFSLFNINSMLIMLLLVCRLVDGGRPRDVLRNAFSNRFFLGYLAVFALEVAGLFYTHDLYTAYKHVESKATLVAIPFVLCSGEVIDRKGWRQLLWGYCWLVAAACLFCLAVAGYRFHQAGDRGVFFYHRLTEAVDSNAVFFSGYVIVALIFLLSPEGKGRFRSGLAVFFTAMMILLASKSLLVFLALIFLVYLRGWSRIRLKTREFAGLAVLVIVGTGALAVTQNPVGRRYQEIMHDNLRYAGKHSFPKPVLFNGISLRLMIWQFAGEILDEQKAWAIGVSSGDSQDLLNRKYLAANMSRGYISYNFHNQFVEILVRSGIAGLCIFLAAIGLLVDLVRRTRTKEAWLVLAMLLLLAMTQSTLEMQLPAFLFCFFPLLFGYREMAPLFRLQASGRIHGRRPERMIADGHKGQQHDPGARQGEYPDMDRDAIGKSIEPFIGGKPGQGCGDDDRQQHHPEKVLADQQTDI